MTFSIDAETIKRIISGKKTKSKGEVRVNCPSCTGGQKETLCVNTQTGLYVCQRCNAAGNYLKINNRDKKPMAVWLYDQAHIKQSHVYISKKKIKPDEIKVDQYENWIIPFKNQSGSIQTIQFIKLDGSKLFLSKKKNNGQGFKGSAYKIEGNNDLVYVCEGAATGHSIHEATGATVYCVGGKDNFKNVIPWIKQQHGEVVVASDNDKSGDGLKAATKAAQKNNCLLSCPEIPGDFNDLAVESGMDAVKKSLETAKRPGDHKPKSTIEIISIADIMNINPQIESIAEGFLNREEPMILHAAGGVGKSTMAQQIAYELARSFDMLGGNMLLETFPIRHYECQSLIIQSENTMAAVNTKSASFDRDVASRIFYPKIFDDVLTTGETFEDQDFIQKIIDTISLIEDKTGKRLDILFVDPLISYHRAEENGAGDMRAALDGITRVAQETKVTPVVLHHDNRNDSYRGSSAINDWCRSRIHMKRVSIGQDRVTGFSEDDQPILRTARIPAVEILHPKANNMAQFETFTMCLSRQMKFVKVENPMDPKIQERCLEVQQALKDIGGYAQSNIILARAISELTGRGVTTCKKDIAEAVKNNLILAENKGNSYEYMLKE